MLKFEKFQFLLLGSFFIQLNIYLVMKTIQNENQAHYNSFNLYYNQYIFLMIQIQKE